MDPRSPPTPSTLSVAIDGDVAVLTIRRPEKRNALDDTTVKGLARALEDLPDGVRAAVLHGEGEHFSAGLDLSEVGGDSDVADGIVHSRMWHRAFEAIQFGRVPVFAALTGAVVGGGFELAAATHVRVADRTAFFALPEGQRGIFLGGGGSVRIPRLVGVALVQDMMLTGRVLAAEEARAAGACQYVVEPGAAFDTALALARKAAKNAPMTNFAILHVLPRTAEADPGTAYLTEALAAAIAQGTPEAKARVRDFLAKRAAKVARPE
jgi:enoyl-CoA hydratase/carnithine racemase